MMQTHEDYQPSYNPEFLSRVREKQRLARIEAMKKAEAEKARREIEARQRFAEELERRRREREQAEQNAKAVAMYRVVDCLNKKPSLTCKEIIRLVGAQHGFTYEEMVGRCRERKLTHARHEAIWRMKQIRPDLALTQIGRAFGRDHSTVIHALQIHAKRLASDASQQAA